jgi:hypothetical protein
VLSASAEAQRVTKQQFEANQKDGPYSYEIQERTKNERVAVGQAREVLRWGPSGQNDQRFTFSRLPNGKYRIRTLRPDVGPQEWLGVGSDGRLVAWAREDNNTQEFTIEWNQDGSFSLQEPTKGEYVTVSSAAFGRLIRWGLHRGDANALTREQTFFLINPRKEGQPPRRGS